MRLLFLSAWCPLPADNGIRLRVANLLRQLARRHEIHLLTFAAEHPGADALRELRTICAEVEIVPETAFANRPIGQLAGFLAREPRSLRANHSPAMAAAVRARAGRGYDLVLASQQHMLPYALLLPNTRRIVDEIELITIRDQYLQEHHPARRARAYLTWWKLTHYLRRVLRDVDGITAVSEPELRLLRSFAPADLRTAVVPNGVDLAAYQPCGVEPTPDLLIYPGSLTFESNFEAVAYFARAILPRIQAHRPQVRLMVTGRADHAQIAALPANPALELVGQLPDVRPAVAGAWAEVVPLLQGSGTRLKILEALALGTPVIATSKGAEGLDLQPGRDLLIADDPDVFAAAVLRVLDDVQLRTQLAVAGRIAVQPYDWSAAATALEHLIAQVAALRV
ncbi:MAG: glycosyltransferase [Oscillochloris sp.]|nr:glycosyltransferase [Oscillochloris sp.]